MLDEKFYLIREDVLPEAMAKALEAKELLARGKVNSVAEAVKKVDLSRSAFYKYRDTVFPFQTIVKEKIISLFFHLDDQKGALSELLAIVANAGCNVLTIHQTIPLQGKANVTLSIDISAVQDDIHIMLTNLKALVYVNKVEILGTGA